MPDRIILAQGRRSPTLQALSDAGERAWWRLTTACDDYGRFEADPDVLLADLFARRPVGWTSAKMARALDEWLAVGLVHVFDHETRLYGHVVTFGKHQRNRTSKPKFPEPPCGNSPQLAAKCGDSRLARAPSGVGNFRESRDESREARDDARAARRGDSPPSAAPPPTRFHVNGLILGALDRTKQLGAVPRLRSPEFWQPEFRANPGVNFAAEILKAEAWLAANPEKRYKRLPNFLHRWLGRAERASE